MTYEHAVETTAHVIDAIGVVIIAALTLWSLLTFAFDTVRRKDAKETYRSLRRRLGRGILVGLEVLLAGDIVKSVAVEPSFRSVGLLASIVAIRTFLSMTLEMEITGAWPWRTRDERL